jgi:galactokinase/mevalonate kinase-like predicted kinase
MIRIGCLGGKILGAGGGGYLLMVAPLDKVEKIESLLQKMNVLYDKPSISNFGTEVLTKC